MKIKINKQGSKFFVDDFKFLKEKGFGSLYEKKYEITNYELIYINEKYNGVEIFDGSKKVTIDTIIKKIDWNAFSVYKDLKNRGYIVKSGTKYGFDFRVYDKGIMDGDDHSKWLVQVYSTKEKFKSLDFISKNRIANDVRKRGMIAFVDDENNIVYYEIAWKRM